MNGDSGAQIQRGGMEARELLRWREAYRLVDAELRAREHRNSVAAEASVEPHPGEVRGLHLPVRQQQRGPRAEVKRARANARQRGQARAAEVDGHEAAGAAG